MRRTALVVLGAALAVAGCAAQKGSNVEVAKSEDAPIPRSFFGRTVTYMVDPDATSYLSKAENLVARAEKLEPPLPDDVLLPIYRDADLDRDHRITSTEAKTFYESYVLRFEDALGRSKY